MIGNKNTKGENNSRNSGGKLIKIIFFLTKT